MLLIFLFLFSLMFIKLKPEITQHILSHYIENFVINILHALIVNKYKNYIIHIKQSQPNCKVLVNRFLFIDLLKQIF